MKLFSYIDGEKTKLGINKEGKRISISDYAQRHALRLPTDMRSVIESYRQLERTLADISESGEFVLEEGIAFAPPVSTAQKILCIGLNYENHIGEMKSERQTVPTVFGKYNNALSAHGEDIILPYEGGHYDYEAELVVVIGRECRRVSPERAGEYIFGYTAGNDLSVREVQTLTSQWLLGKSFDGFAPMGPDIVTADSISPNELEIKSIVNGEVRQLSNTSNMIFSCEEIVSYLSRYMTLLPGDLIFTGTPGGVILGYPEHEQVWLTHGDRVDVVIEGMAPLSNRLKK